MKNKLLLLLLLIFPLHISAGDKLYADNLFSWAENEYPGAFPPNQTSLEAGDWYYRYYNITGNALGLKIDDKDIYVYVGASSSLIKIGTLSDLLDLTCNRDSNNTLDDMLPSYYIRNAFAGTPLEGANRNPSIFLPEDMLSYYKEQSVSNIGTVAFYGFKAPECYEVLGGKTIIKLVKELNIDSQNYHSSAAPVTGISRFEDTKIDVYIDNVSGAAEAVNYVNKALSGVLTLNIVESAPKIGITFINSSEPYCGDAAGEYVDEGYNYGRKFIKRTIRINPSWPCGTKINGIIHEIGHALGYNAHTVIKNTVMTVGGIWNDAKSYTVGRAPVAKEGELDKFTISFFTNLYAIPLGSIINNDGTIPNSTLPNSSTTSVTMTGTVSFVDSNANSIPIPSDAAIRITANNQYSEAVTSSINSDGSFSVTKNMFNNLFVDGNSFSIIIFKNHINPDTVSNQCGEDYYKWVGTNLSFGSWENITVSPSDYQDNSGQTCTQ
ncbi:MAG: hypothetical protein QM504_06290 [Pseudomonadota bacterium]